MRINITSWKEFQIGEIFEIINGKGVTKQDISMEETSISAIQSGEENFGRLGYISKEICEKKGYRVFVQPALTVARRGSSGYVGFQETPFVVGDSAKALLPKKKVSKDVLLFLRAILLVNKKNYFYIDKVSTEKYAKDVIKLPVDKTGEPDWNYMEEYIQEKQPQTLDKVVGYNKIINAHETILNVDRWERFPLYHHTLFEIDAGNKLDRVKMTDKSPSISFVGRANPNNGVTAIVDRIKDIKPYQPGMLTVSLGGEYLGSCFVQDNYFYTSQNVNVLIPRGDMPFEAKQFIACMIFKEGQTYYKAFIDELNRHMKTDFSILLPVDNKGEPDWSFMISYIKSIKKTVNKKISEFLSMNTYE